jgi:hypothetical protein
MPFGSVDEEFARAFGEGTVAPAARRQERGPLGRTTMPGM